MGRHLWPVEIPHSCSLAAAPYVILPSVPQKTLKLHLDGGHRLYFGLSEDTGLKKLAVSLEIPRRRSDFPLVF